MQNEIRASVLGLGEVMQSVLLVHSTKQCRRLTSLLWSQGRKKG